MEPTQIPFSLPDGSSNAMTCHEGDRHGAPVFVILPAMGVKASFYQDLAAALAGAGFVAVTADLRGNGESSVRPSAKVDFAYHDILDLDYAYLVKAVKARYPGRKVFLLGHSLGGQLASLYLSDHPEGIDGLILVACCSVYYKGWKGFARFRVLMGTQFARMVSLLLGYFPGKTLKFGGTEAKGVIRDWSRQARTGRYLLGKARVDYDKKLEQLSLPVLAISFEVDTLAPKAAVEHLLQKFSPNAAIIHHHLLPDHPENDNYHHFNWPKKPGNIVGMIQNWV